MTPTRATVGPSGFGDAFKARAAEVSDEYEKRRRQALGDLA